jgi:hypothetical protein
MVNVDADPAVEALHGGLERLLEAGIGALG